ncbi:MULTISPECIES: AraC family transcriptional regulator [unclassified Nostoc]|uniref:AraC family transcriptional regulator n=1 Tax=unclassified Nostoc TaxID=2593658 RepID=UPI002AD34E96|nr:AraC family transcriptional regulator [Nostoc sp. DedQUE03]MDZ7971413.1 AraC family transcriptional regulator [Nostoc sp. DedQUE03]MDZ8046317.1 AraC family transcriptional regulator [Nostoc sp. DedQUE02]
MKSEQLSAIEVASGNLVPMSSKPPILSSTNHWNGIVLEQHHLPAFECPELCLQQHSINIWLGNSCQIDWRLAGGRLQSTQMKRGLVNVTPKGIPTQARWHQEIKFLLVSFDSSLFKRVADDAIAGRYRTIEIIPQRGVCDRQILHLGMALKAELEAGCPSGKLYGESVATALAAHLLKTYSGTRQLITEFEINLSKRQLRQIIDYIYDNLALELTLVELASLVNMSSYSFCRWFKRLMGISPHQYVIKCRIERAKFLLTYSQLPIIEITYQIGCSSQSNFTTIFRKHVGITPQAYREMI